MWRFGPPRQWRRWFRGQRRQLRWCCHKQGADEAQKRENDQDGSQEANHGQTIPEHGLDTGKAFTEERSTWTRGLTRSCRGWCCSSTSAGFAALSAYRWRSCWGMGSRPARGSPRRDRSDCWAPLDGGGHSRGVCRTHHRRRRQFFVESMTGTGTDPVPGTGQSEISTTDPAPPVSYYRSSTM